MLQSGKHNLYQEEFLGEDTLALRLDESHSVACWLVHDEDDNPENSEGLKYRTNGPGSSPFGDGIPTFFFLRLAILTFQ